MLPMSMREEGAGVGARGVPTLNVDASEAGREGEDEGKGRGKGAGEGRVETAPSTVHGTAVQHPETVSRLPLPPSLP